MKLLIDANLSFRLAHHLKQLDCEFAHTNGVGLGINPKDLVIWNFAKSNNCCILTRDIDFLLLSMQFGSPPQVILLSTANKSTKEFAELLLSRWEVISSFASSENSLLEITA